jgi:predicted Zn-ribbon and HTH transcriptional regulator
MLTIQAYTCKCIKCARQFLSSSLFNVQSCPFCKTQTLAHAKLETVAIKPGRGYPRAMEQARD